MDYIVPALGGRLGNHLFMIAHAYAKGLEYNKRVVIYKPHVIHHGHDYSTTIFRKLDYIDTWEENRNNNPNPPSDDKHSIYVGYYQSESYFERYSENIKSLFGAPLEFVYDVKKEFPFIFNKTTTVINVRRGDYLHSPNYHPTVTPQYIKEATKRIPNTDVYLVASDDIPWCKDNLQLDKPVVYLENKLPHEQLWILSMCQHFVLSNSSFSWWAAYLCRNPKKIVVVPETWFGPEYKHGWENIYCKDWIILPTYFDKGLILPK